MILKRIKVNAGAILGINCYIVQDENTKEAMIIDPGGSPAKIIEMLDAIGAKVKYILLTHCHGDHIGAVNEIREKTDCCFYYNSLFCFNYQKNNENINKLLDLNNKNIKKTKNMLDTFVIKC